MKIDITDKIPVDLRDRWLRYFEDITGFQDTLERLLMAQAATMRRLRLNERSLWKEIATLLEISGALHDYQLFADLDSQRIFLTGLELPKPAEPVPHEHPI